MFRVEKQSSHRFEDLKTLQHGWKFGAAQLAPSEGESEVVFFQAPNVGYNYFRYKSSYDQTLRSKSGFINFGLFEPDNPTTWTYDQVIPNDAITVFPSEVELNGVSPSGFHGNGMHFSESYLRNLAESVYRRPLEELVPPAGIYRPVPEKLAMLRSELHKWKCIERYDASGSAGIIATREESLALAVIDCVSDAGRFGDGVSSKTAQSMPRLLEFIHDSELETISSLELCRQAGCSQRSIEKCFKGRFGVTPKKYIKSLRLARVRHGLRNFEAEEFESIIELAGIHGFWHMGQFAADYRKIYGELPSETLKRK